MVVANPMPPVLAICATGGRSAARAAGTDPTAGVAWIFAWPEDSLLEANEPVVVDGASLALSIVTQTGDQGMDWVSVHSSRMEQAGGERLVSFSQEQNQPSLCFSRRENHCGWLEFFSTEDSRTRLHTPFT